MLQSIANHPLKDIAAFTAAHRVVMAFMLACLPSFAAIASTAAATHLGQGLLIGETTATTAILQTRLTATPGLLDGDVPGTAGVARFEIATTPDFANPRLTPWLDAAADSDFIVKTRIDGLAPATTHHVRVHHGADRDNTRPSPAATFRTLPAADDASPVDFIMLSCLNYAFFQHGDKNHPPAQAEDRALGYPALEAIHRLAPGFVILNGDCVYYDHPWDSRAQTQTELRKKWHEQYVMPRFVKLFATTPTYWLKDDHDHRFNDSDATGELAPSHALGIATFREQVPVTDPLDPAAPTYRTHRVGRDLQLWFVEGRDHRSPNNMPDGPDKSLWGAEQRAWLRRTLLESDATFKILVSPTPLIGPDDGYKKDNHANLNGFHHEGRAFLDWLRQNNISPDRFLILCGDRHWKYHSIDSTGYVEFSCGALNKENSRLGRPPGDPKSNDPEAKIRQPYTDKPASGGFLQVRVKDQSLEVILHNDAGQPLHHHRLPNPLSP
jgi:alkaline phosphatase/alkaline phosphatase D